MGANTNFTLHLQKSSMWKYNGMKRLENDIDTILVNNK